MFPVGYRTVAFMHTSIGLPINSVVIATLVSFKTDGDIATKVTKDNYLNASEVRHLLNLCFR